MIGDGGYTAVNDACTQLREAVAEFFAGGFADALSRRLNKDGPDEGAYVYDERVAKMRAALSATKGEPA